MLGWFVILIHTYEHDYPQHDTEMQSLHKEMIEFGEIQYFSMQA